MVYSYTVKFVRDMYQVKRTRRSNSLGFDENSLFTDWLFKHHQKKCSKSSSPFAKRLKHKNEKKSHGRNLSCLILVLIWFGMRVKELKSNAIDVLS